MVLLTVGLPLLIVGIVLIRIGEGDGDDDKADRSVWTGKLR